MRFRADQLARLDKLRLERNRRVMEGEIRRRDAELLADLSPEDVETAIEEARRLAAMHRLDHPAEALYVTELWLLSGGAIPWGSATRSLLTEVSRAGVAERLRRLRTEVERLRTQRDEEASG